jgi:hypothetical protein
VNTWVRVAAALCLCLSLGGLFVHAEITDDQRNPYPDAAELNNEYSAYVGQTVVVFGTVVETTDQQLRIEAEEDGTTITLAVTGADATVSVGGAVQVYGTLEPDQTIAAERVEIVNSGRWAELYKYGTSTVGAVGFLVLFFRYWRLNRDSWSLEARDG